MSTEQPAVAAVALPATTLKFLVGSIIAAVVVMSAMLALEVVILIQVFELNDLVGKLVLPGL